MNNTNLVEIFDAITGHGGAASVDGWREMSVDELFEQAHGQADHYYAPITDDEAMAIAKSCALAQEAESSNFLHALRVALESGHVLDPAE